MAAVTICSDSGAPKSLFCFYFITLRGGCKQSWSLYQSMFCLSLLPIFPSRGWDYQPSFKLFHQFEVAFSVWVQAVCEFHSLFTWETSAWSYSLAVNNWHCQHPTCRRARFSLQPFPAFIGFRLLANVHSDLCEFWLAFLLRFHHVEIFSYDFSKNSVSKTDLCPIDWLPISNSFFRIYPRTFVENRCFFPFSPMKVESLSHVRLFATPWTVAYQAPLSMGLSRQEYWSGVPFPSPMIHTNFVNLLGPSLLV